MKHNPMQSLINLAQMRQEARLKQLGHLLAAGRSQEEKLVLLQNYRRDYQAKLTAGSQRGRFARIVASSDATNLST